MGDIAEAATADAEPTPEELKKQLEAAVAENATLAKALTDKTSEVLGLEEERNSLAVGLLAAERERVRMVDALAQAAVDRAADAEGLEKADRERAVALLLEREQLQREFSALILERDAAVSALQSGLRELADQMAMRWVDKLHLSWDGTAALDAQLDDIRRQLDGIKP